MSDTNNITLDKIVTKVSSKEYLDNYDAIFRKGNTDSVGGNGVSPSKPVVTPKEVKGLV